MLVGILPGDAYGVGQRVLPLGRVILDAQQVQIVHHATGGGGTVVAGAPAPVLGDGAAHAVGQVVKRAAVGQYARLHGLHQGAVNEGVGCLLCFRREEVLVDGLKVRLLTGERALHLEEVGGSQVLIVYIGHAPRQFHLRLLAA